MPGYLADPLIPRLDNGRIALCHRCQRDVYWAKGFMRYLTNIHAANAREARSREFASHRITSAQSREIIRLATKEYCGVREISRRLSLPKNTVMTYFPADADCPCGRRLLDHRGWCSYRYAKSAARQAVVAKLPKGRAA